ncbi:hypothetical protein F0562_013495 [Nyssa sinensis]|uniref:PB1-like domain-containing protein n=1 Tax=Nyssa sinensis TaxID=561372 RepID=A0A5J4ZMQ2_9ASTE|nr:hypothetical protein F0562_013495 [Nyssa sinensis]
MFTLEGHHGGQFVKVPQTLYVKGEVEFIHNVDVDLMSYFEMLDIVEQLGHPKTCKMYHSEKKVISIYIQNIVNGLKGEDNVQESHALMEHVTGNESENGSGSENDSDFEYFADGDKLDDVVLTDESLFEDLFDEFSVANEGSATDAGDSNRGLDSMKNPTNVIVDDEIKKDDIDIDGLKSPRNSDDELFIEYIEFNEDRDMESQT